MGEITRNDVKIHCSKMCWNIEKQRGEGDVYICWLRNDKDAMDSFLNLGQGGFFNDHIICWTYNRGK